MTLFHVNGCVPLPSPEEMAHWDRIAVYEVGLRSELLMENAGREALAVFELELGDPAGLMVLCFAGPGNNGGDAFSLARHLHDRGAQVVVFHTRPKQNYKGAAGYHLALASRAGVPLRFLTAPRAHCDLTRLFGGNFRPDAVVDGLLGIGFIGELKPKIRGLVEWINSFGPTLGGLGAFILALDVPSGLNAVTGKPASVAVRAVATVTFEAPKLGLVQPEAAAYIGRLYVRPIGIPRVVRERHPTRSNLLTRDIVRLAPQNMPTMHKGIAGRVLIIGGSTGLTGAAVLTGLAAMRGGAGLTSLACPAVLATEAKTGFPELVTLPLGSDSRWRAELVKDLLPHLESTDALVLGPGLGRDPEVYAFLTEFLTIQRPVTVIDADALYWLGRQPELRSLLRPGDILTPHPGEMAGLLGTETTTVSRNRLNSALKLSEDYKVLTVLKGAGTVIATPIGTTCMSPFTCPTLAVGGSGDVLAGLMAAILGRGVASLPATCLAVYWHGFCGTLLSRIYPHRGNLAREIAQALPWALKELYDADISSKDVMTTLLIDNNDPRNRYKPNRDFVFKVS